MKRSEMLEIMINNIVLFRGQPTPENYAIFFLNIIEEAGMLPPLNENNYHHMDNHDRQVVNFTNTIYTWEPEDE